MVELIGETVEEVAVSDSVVVVLFTVESEANVDKTDVVDSETVDDTVVVLIVSSEDKLVLVTSEV